MLKFHYAFKFGDYITLVAVREDDKLYYFGINTDANLKNVDRFVVANKKSFKVDFNYFIHKYPDFRKINEDDFKVEFRRVVKLVEAAPDGHPNHPTLTT